MDKIIIHTDGACSNNQSKENIGGYGAILQYKDYKKEIFDGEKNTTNNRMELKAIIESLKILKRKDIPVEIYTDSAYIANCMNQKWYIKWKSNGWVTSKKSPVENKELWEQLINLADDLKDIKFIKVKGHNGHELNERADFLAKEGIKKVKNE